MWSIRRSSESSIKNHREPDCSEYPEISRMSVNGSCWQPVPTEGRADPHRMENRETHRGKQKLGLCHCCILIPQTREFPSQPTFPPNTPASTCLQHTHNLLSVQHSGPFSTYCPVAWRRDGGTIPNPEQCPFVFLWHLLAWRN